MITLDQIHAISGNTSHGPAKRAFIERIEQAASAFPDFRRPHVIAQLLGQVCVESGYFRYTKELWGPTAAQRRYEGRADLGNVHPGDGKKYMGRDFIQCTGRANYRALTTWLRKIIPNCPDFEANPDALLDPKWLGWSVVWYWTQRVPSRYVDSGNNEMVTRRVNGGLNHYAERLKSYDRAALVLLGMAADDVRGFQKWAGITVDGISGPATRAALHKALLSKTQRTAPTRPTTAPTPTKPASGATAPATGGLGAFFAAIIAAISAMFKKKG